MRHIDLVQSRRAVKPGSAFMVFYLVHHKTVSKTYSLISKRGEGGRTPNGKCRLKFPIWYILHTSLSRGVRSWSFRFFCVGIILYSHHHRHFVFVTLWLFWWPAAMNSVFAKANRGVCYPNWIFAQLDLMFAQSLCLYLYTWTWNISCKTRKTLKNVSNLDVQPQFKISLLRWKDRSLGPNLVIQVKVLSAGPAH